MEFVHKVQVYYEDTDHSGVVYHANYLKYFERAREHMLGISKLLELQKNQGIGFVVYKADLSFHRGAEFGDSLLIHTEVEKASEYRLIFDQQVKIDPHQPSLVKGVIHLACVNQQKKLVPIPKIVTDELQAKNYFSVKKQINKT